MDNSELFSRIFDKFDKFEERLNTTCNTITKIDTTLENFIESVNKREKENKEALERKYKNITVVFGSITSLSVIMGLSKAFGLF